MKKTSISLILAILTINFQPSKLIAQHSFELKVDNNTVGTKSLQYGPNINMALSLESNKILLWDVNSNKLIRIFEDNESIISTACFSPNNLQIASGYKNNFVRIWDVKSGKVIKNFNVGKYGIKNVHFSSDGEIVYAVSNDDKIYFLNVESEKCIYKLKDAGSSSTQLSGNGKYLISHVGQFVKVIDVKNKKIINTINCAPTKFAISNEGNQLITYNQLDKTFTLWETSSGNIIKSFKKEKIKIIDLCFSYNDELVYISESNGDVKTLNINSGEMLTPIFTNKSVSSSDIKNIFNGNYLISVTKNKIDFWDIKSLKQIGSIEATRKQAITIFSKDGQFLAVCDKDTSEMKIIEFVELESGVRIKSAVTITDKELMSHPDFFLNKKKSHVIFKGGYYGNKAELFEISSGNRIKTFSCEGWSETDHHICFSPDGEKILTTIIGSYMNDSLVLFDTKSGLRLKNFIYSSSVGYYNTTGVGMASSICFSQDGNNCLVGYDGWSEFGMILWNISTGKIDKFIGKGEEVNKACLTPDGKKIVTDKLKIWDVQSGKMLLSINNFPYLSPEYNHYIKISSDGNFALIFQNTDVSLVDIKFGKILKKINFNDFTNPTIFPPRFSSDGKYLIYFENNSYKFWDINDGRDATDLYVNIKQYNPSIKLKYKPIYVLPVGINPLTFCDAKTNQNLISLYFFEKGSWVAVTPDGRFDGDNNGMKQLYYVKGLDIIPLESLFEQYYTPNLLARVMAGEQFEPSQVKVAELKSAPLVKISSPENNSKNTTNQITVTVDVTDMGGGIDEILLYHNGKLVETTNRGFKEVEQKDSKSLKTFTIPLSNGENKIKATAFNRQRTEAIPDEITVNYAGIQASKPNLYILVIGIDKYKNPKYNLNYAVADATSFKSVVEIGAKDIFDSENIIFLNNENATRIKILEAISEIKSKIKQNDVFVFYYAGHGVMSEEAKSKFYLIPYDVTQLYGDNKMLQTFAISSDELQSFATIIKAQKQLYIFDACQSGGMVDALVMRGAAEEKAIAQLARSTGTYWLAASGTQQFSTEFAQLGHGIFTYTLLLGLKGEADGQPFDKKITAEEISTFIKNKLPELSEKYKGSAQYPNSYGYGTDFPIIIIK